MSVIIGGVTCEEIVSNFGEAGGSGGLSAEKGYLCDWGGRYAVANSLLGISSSSTVGGWITISSPGRYQDSANIYCTDVRIEGVGTPTAGPNQIQFPKAIVWATYSSPIRGGEAYDDPYKAHSLDPAVSYTYATQSIDIGSEYVTIPGKSLKCVNSMGFPTIMDIDQGIFVGIAHLNLTLYRVPYLPWPQILDTISKVNASTFMSCPAEQVRFDGARSERTANSDGTITQTISYAFTFRTKSWNKAFHPDGTSGWRPLTDISGNSLHETADLSVVFPLGRAY